MAKDKLKEKLTPEQIAEAKELKAKAEALGLTLVDPEGLRKMMETMDELSKQVKENESKINAVADKNRLNTFEEKNKVPQKPTVRISKYDENGTKFTVLGWTNLVVDQVYKNNNGAYVENQIVKLILKAPTEENPEAIKKVELPYMDFVKMTSRINATINNKFYDDKDNLILDVVTEEGEELKIAATFVN